MIFDLSSKITLERIPTRYYRTSDPVEAIRQTRYEKLRTEIYETDTEGSAVVAREIATLIRAKAEKGLACVLGIPGGSTPMKVYKELVKLHQREGLSFKNVFIFNVNESQDGKYR